MLSNTRYILSSFCVSPIGKGWSTESAIALSISAITLSDTCQSHAPHTSFVCAEDYFMVSMVEMGVPEKIIMKRMGHKTLDALQTYERKNDELHKTVSHILSNNARNPVLLLHLTILL